MRLSIASRLRSTRVAAFACVALALLLTVTSPLRLVGDGPEYLAMAEHMSHFGGPSLTADDARERGLEYPDLRTADDRQVLPHFWLYSAVVAPLLAAAHALAVNPLLAFTWTNGLLLAAAAWLVGQRYRPATAVLLLAGPIVWWIDKAHTEVFAYSWLTATVVLWPTWPVCSVLAAALLSAQHPQALAFFACVAARHLVRPRTSPDRRTPAVLVELMAAATTAGAYSAYYLWRIGRWTPLVESRDLRVPALKTAGAVLWDLNIGLVVNAPFTALAIMTAAVVALRSGARRFQPEWVWLGFSLPLLFAFAQTMNVNHGGTPGMSRYALWLLPVAAPLFDAAYRVASTQWRRGLTILVAASVVWSVVYFRPARGEGFLEPSPLAQYQWQHYPDLMDPLPEIFAERTRHQESVNVFAATPTCSKALLQSGQWPFPCAPMTAAIPPECRPDGVLCYANRTSRGYVFHVTSRRGGLSLRIP